MNHNHLGGKVVWPTKRTGKQHEKNGNVLHKELMTCWIGTYTMVH